MNINSSKIIESLRSHKLVDGLTHNLYSYPARFSPELAREIIQNFSSAGDWLLDPFMGGGTLVVEALAAGRSALGVDINSLAWFISLSKTTALSSKDIVQLRDWATNICLNNIDRYPSLELDELRRHFPKRFLYFLDEILENVERLTSQNAKRISRFVLLRVYQDLLNDKDKLPTSAVVKRRIAVELERTLSGLSDFFDACHKSGTPKREITSRRKLLNRSCIGIESECVNDLRQLF